MSLKLCRFGRSALRLCSVLEFFCLACACPCSVSFLPESGAVVVTHLFWYERGCLRNTNAGEGRASGNSLPTNEDLSGIRTHTGGTSAVTNVLRPIPRRFAGKPGCTERNVVSIGRDARIIRNATFARYLSILHFKNIFISLMPGVVDIIIFMS